MICVISLSQRSVLFVIAAYCVFVLRRDIRYVRTNIGALVLAILMYYVYMDSLILISAVTKPY